MVGKLTGQALVLCSVLHSRYFFMPQLKFPLKWLEGFLKYMS